MHTAVHTTLRCCALHFPSLSSVSFHCALTISLQFSYNEPKRLCWIFLCRSNDVDVVGRKNRVSASMQQRLIVRHTHCLCWRSRRVRNICGLGDFEFRNYIRRTVLAVGWRCWIQHRYLGNVGQVIICVCWCLLNCKCVYISTLEWVLKLIYQLRRACQQYYVKTLQFPSLANTGSSGEFYESFAYSL